MKTSIFTACLLASIFVATAFADEPAERPAEKVDAIKRSQFVRTQYEIFNQTDKNFDGKITHDEVLRLMHERNKPKYVAAFKAIDENKNGFLSGDEIEAKHEEFTSKHIDRLSKTKAGLLKRYDEDGDGTITSRELDVYLERQIENRRGQTASNAAKDLKGKDADESGSVSLDEYLESKTMGAIKILKQPDLAVQSLTRDPNGDKIITRSENEAFVVRLFEELDKNKDDELSAAEQASSAFKQAKTISTRTLFLTDGKASVFQYR